MAGSCSQAKSGSPKMSKSYLDHETKCLPIPLEAMQTLSVAQGARSNLSKFSFISSKMSLLGNFLMLPFSDGWPIWSRKLIDIVSIVVEHVYIAPVHWWLSWKRVARKYPLLVLKFNRNFMRFILFLGVQKTWAAFTKTSSFLKGPFLLSLMRRTWWYASFWLNLNFIFMC